jgi:3-deoxy-7-phosphoheptulonate synthase
MIIVLEPDLDDVSEVVDAATTMAGRYEQIEVMLHRHKGTRHAITEVHLVGMTARVPTEPFAALPGVLRVVRVSAKYRLIGRHHPDTEAVGFEYNGIPIDGDHVNIVAGLCAVDTPEHVDQTMGILADMGIRTTRMGAYKPRTSPYDFQGLGAKCLPWVFESAGKHGIRIVTMEVTDTRHIDEITQALQEAGNPTGVMLQIGTRNAQNFELLKAVGQHGEFPALVKRGMGITLEESLNACEYVASEGNPRIVFCLRGVKTNLGDPHRNLVDFTHVPVVLRQTRLPVCIDPSHSVGRMFIAPDGLPDIFHAVGQGIIAGATMVLVDFHPRPEVALCDGPQALTLDMLPKLVEYANSMRTAYKAAVEQFSGAAANV